jgi:hypothetical protein
MDKVMKKVMDQSMKNHYIESANEVSKLAEKFSNDYDLSNVLKSGAAKIVKLAKQSEGMLLKVASVDSSSKEV